MSKQQSISATLSGYLQPGEQLLGSAYAEESSHDLARIALAGLSPSSASKFMVGLTANRVMLHLDNLGTKMVKPKDTDNIFLHDIAHLEFTPKRHSVKASFILRNGKKRSFQFLNHPGDNVSAARSLLETLQGMLQGAGPQQSAYAPRQARPAAAVAPEPPPCRPAQPTPPRPVPPRPTAQPAPPRPEPRMPPRPGPSAGSSACPACGHQCTPEDRFCEMCGAPVQQAGPKFCPQCGRQTRANAKFCGGCGCPLQR